MNAIASMPAGDHADLFAPATPLALKGRLVDHFRGVPEAWAPILMPDGVAGVLELCDFVDARSNSGAVIFPPDPFAALRATAPGSVSVVILGQDPYHGPGQAHGLAFSVPDGVKLPPSLRNIYKELQAEFGRSPTSGNLRPWAEQGVLLLNTTLTVEDGRPASHAGRGWGSLTDRLVRWLAADASPKAFLLWGAHAQAKASLMSGSGHLVLQSNHPSPLSATRGPAPFMGCGHFRRANDWLRQCGRAPIDWVPAI